MPQAGTTAGSKSSTQKQRELIFCNENKKRGEDTILLLGGGMGEDSGACKEFCFRAELYFSSQVQKIKYWDDVGRERLQKASYR